MAMVARGHIEAGARPGTEEGRKRGRGLLWLLLAGLGLLDLALILSLIFVRRDAPPAEVLVDGQPLAARVGLQRDRIYVDAHPLARALGLEVSYDPRRPHRGLVIQGKEGFLFLELSSFICHVRDKEALSGAPVFYLDGTTRSPMVPAGLVAGTLGARVEENGSRTGRRRLSITSPRPRGREGSSTP